MDEVFAGISIARVQPGIGKDKGDGLILPNLFKTVKKQKAGNFFKVSKLSLIKYEALSGTTN